MKLRLIIVDDEPLARARLRHLLRKEPEVEIISECANGPEFLTTIGAREVDLVLLDVQMPEMDGFQVVSELGSGPMPAIIFVTAFDQHAVRAFEVGAVDYLLKPVSQKRLKAALDRVRERATRAPQPMPQALMNLITERESNFGPLRRLLVRDRERVIFVPVAEIDWIEAAGNYVILHVQEKTHIIRNTLTEMEKQLPKDIFIRVSRAAIVNLSRVVELQSGAMGEHIALLVGGQRVPMTRSFRDIEDRLRYA